jgi:F-type H+-transporting ATPase subunit epsilon
MADAFALEVVTPEQDLLAGPATALILRTAEGNLTVLDGHTPLIGNVEPGEVRVEQEDGSVVRLAVHGGFLQVDTRPGAADGADPAAQGGPIPGLSTRVTVLAGIAELVTEIDVARAQAAKERVESALADLRGAGSRPSEQAEEGAASAEAALVEAEEALARAELRLSLTAPDQHGA